jgi:hypothetical protein
MVSAILALLGLVLFIYVCKKLSRFCFRAADYLDEREEHRLYNERCIRESLEDIRGSIAQPEDEPLDYKERLLRANQQIAEKDRLSEAIKNELGIM